MAQSLQEALEQFGGKLKTDLTSRAIPNTTVKRSPAIAYEPTVPLEPNQPKPVRVSEDIMAEKPTLGSIFKRAVQQETLIGGGIRATEALSEQAYDPNFTDDEKIKLIQESGIPKQFYDELYEAGSKTELNFLINRVMEEIDFQQDVSERGAAGILTLMGGAMLDPSNLVGVGEVAAIAKLPTAARIMSRATILGLENAAQESLIMMSKSTGEYADVGMAFAAGVGLGAGAGTISSLIGTIPAKKLGLSDQLDTPLNDAIKADVQFAAVSKQAEESVSDTVLKDVGALEQTKLDRIIDLDENGQKNLASLKEDAPEQVSSLGGLSLAQQLMSSSSPYVRGLAGRLVENPGRPSRHTVVMDAEYALNQFRTKHYGYQTALNDWKKVNRIGIISDLSSPAHTERFNKQVHREINAIANNKETTTEGLIGGEYVRAAAESHIKTNKLILQQLKASGVDAAKDVDMSKVYTRHKWSPNKFIEAELKLRRVGVTDTKGAIIRTLSRAIRQNMSNVGIVNLKLSDKFASAIYNRMITKGIEGDGVPLAIFEKGNRRLLDDIMEEIDVAQKDREGIWKILEGTATGRASGKYKARIELDLDQGIDPVTGLDLYDLLDTNIEVLADSSMREAAGEIALAKAGIKSRDEWNNLKSDVFAESFNEAATGKYKYTTKMKDDDAKMLDGFYDLIMGRLPVDQNQPKAWLAVRSATTSARLKFMGLTQLSETGRVVGMIGIKNALRAIPELGKLNKSLLTGNVSDEFLGSMERFFGITLGKDAYIAPSTIMAEEGGRLLSDAYKGFGAKIQNIFPKLNQYNTILSGQQLVMGIQQRIVMKSLAQDLFDAVKGKGLSLDNIEKRFADSGLSRNDLTNIMDNMKKYGEYDAKKRVGNMNFDKWDAVSAEIFREGLTRSVNTAVQKHMIGEKSLHMYNPLISMFTQFLDYPIVAAEKQLKRAFVTGGTSKVAMVTAYSSASAAAIYMMKTYINSLGRSDAKQYRNERLSSKNIAFGTMQLTTTASVLPDMYQLGEGLVTGSPFGDLTRRSAAVNYVNDIAHVLTKGAAAPFSDDINFTEADYRKTFGLFPLLDLPYFKAITNSMADYLE